MKTLKNILGKITYKVIQGTDELNINNICWDSRKAAPNSLFICVKCKNVDRHNFISQAINNGATAVVIEHELQGIPSNITIIKVENSKLAVSEIANNYFEEPSKNFNLIGVTGTNGKTSVCHLISKTLEIIGRKAGVIGTIENSINSCKLKSEKLNPTTPDALELQGIFSELMKCGATDVAMEVTSTALESYRVHNCDFNIGVFTNLSQDHLDEHGSMENYKKAKLKLFQMCKLGIINKDDSVSQDIIKSATCDIITYGIDDNADLMAKDIQYSPQGTAFTLHFCNTKKAVTLNMPGKFNVYNALAAIACCYLSGFPLDIIINALKAVPPPKGRFEPISNNKDCLIVVDYAHTPDALENTLFSARKLTKNKLILVFGCGGDRDKTKRPVMGKIAGSLADFCIITSDNPRTEDPFAIIEDIELGIKATGCSYYKSENRKKAIHFALEKAEAGDTIIIAGKGHENYQLIGEKALHFDDTEIVKEYLIS